MPQSEPRLRALLEARTTDHDLILVAVDQSKTIGAMVFAVAVDPGMDVVYLPSLTMRRVATLRSGQAKMP